LSANEDSAGGSPTVEYIQHHLTNFCVGSCDPVTHKGVGFWALHIDTVIVSATLGALMIFVAWRTGRNMSVSAPAGLQNFVEMIVEFVQGQVKDSFPDKKNHADRAAGADDLRLGLADELHGRGADRPAAVDRRSCSASNTSSSCRPPTSTPRWRWR
jgi:hypothetical protein